MEEVIYREDVRSIKTEQLFILLALAFFALGLWRFSAVGFKFVPGLFIILGMFFAFYIVNYRVLKITITDQGLRLKFGLISWNTDFENIKECLLDDAPEIIKYGGAGVHFAFVQGEYRAFYNFLEYPRILVRFELKQGWVKALVFSTRNPETIIELLQERMTTR